MSKVLKPYTIIPDELYVERAADRQLQRIVSEMGRPGYVLVARQMGKTNLLLNARRKSDADSLFIYVDVSNTAPDLRSFFRGVVDTCLESESVIPESVKSEIRGARSNDARLEHREHEWELRRILASIPGRLVFFLDEIDALTRVEYSDRVFAFIRSVYFSGRTSFPEFARMTYVLSGVAEPSEIIKDRSISPFNIGEKIYLEDFIYDELVEFTRKAGVSWSGEILDRIYYWSSGNPRISWDICSSLEDIGSKLLRPGDVDDIVERLYLGSFDLPPVDHIRALVQSDKDIRSAVMSIHYGKSESISDSVRSRMYLAGIMSSSSFVGEVRIKNKVTECALSERWLNEIEQEGVSLEDQAESLYAAGRYADAYDIYVEMDAVGEVGDVDLHAYRKAYCLYFMGVYDKSIDILEANIYPRSKSRDFHIRSLSLLGTMNLMAGRVEPSIAYLEKAISEYGDMGGDSPLDYLTCLVNLSTAYLSSGSSNDRLRQLCDDAVTRACSRLGASDQDSESLRALICSAYHNLYSLDLAMGLLESSEVHLNRAIEFSGRSDKASLMLIKAHVFQDDIPIAESLGSCVDYCIQNSVPVKAVRTAERPLSFTLARAANLTYYLAKREGEGSSYLKAALEHFERRDIGHEVGMAKVAHGAAGIAIRNKEWSAAGAIYGVAGGLVDSDEEMARALLLNAGAFGSEDELHAIADKIVPLIVGEYDGVGAYVAHRLAQAYVGRNELRAALEVLGMVDPNGELSNIDRLTTIVRKYVISKRIGEGVPEGRDVRMVYDLVAGIPVGNGDLYDRSYKSVLMRELVNAYPELSSMKPVGIKKYGRNDIVKVKLSNGEVVIGKYKKYEEIIRRGQAQLID